MASCSGSPPAATAPSAEERAPEGPGSARAIALRRASGAFSFARGRPNPRAESSGGDGRVGAHQALAAQVSPERARNGLAHQLEVLLDLLRRDGADHDARHLGMAE